MCGGGGGAGYDVTNRRCWPTARTCNDASKYNARENGGKWGKMGNKTREKAHKLPVARPPGTKLGEQSLRSFEVPSGLSTMSSVPREIACVCLVSSSLARIRRRCLRGERSLNQALRVGAKVSGYGCARYFFFVFPGTAPSGSYATTHTQTHTHKEIAAEDNA